MSKAKTQKYGVIGKIKWAYAIISAFLIALGVFTFVWPEMTAGTICSAMGVAAIVFGIILIITYFLREIKGVALTYDFSIGVLAVACGLILLIGRDRVVDLLQVVIGVYLIVDSVFKLQTALDAKRLGISGWWLSLILTAACLALGIVLTVKVGGSLLMMLIGAALIADGFQNLFLVVFSAAAARALSRAKKETEPAAAQEPPVPAEAVKAQEPAESAETAKPLAMATAAESQTETPKIDTAENEEGSNET